ncbi:MAG: CHAT domain-containing protein [Pseudomonadota bacterium]
MTIESHARLAESGLFDGPVDPAAVAAWPTWAREHLRVCPECLSLLDAERELRRVLALLAERDSHPRRLPSPAERRDRLRRRQAPPPDALPRGQVALPRRSMRAGGSPLELVRTSRGVRLWHPDATEVLVVVGGLCMIPAVIRHAREETPGIALDLEIRPEHSAEVLAVAAREPLEPEHWVLWLQDALASGGLAALVEEGTSEFVHLARVTLPAPLKASLLRLRPDPLPEATPAVAGLLKQAAQAGREDRVVNAAELYQRALERAFSDNDDSGQIKAAMGLSLALRGLGYEVDADRVLRWLIDTHALDRLGAGRVCRHLATDAVNRLDLEAADDWLRDAEAIEGVDAVWVRVVQLCVAVGRRHDAKALEIARSLLGSDLPEPTRQMVQLHSALALARMGEPEAAAAEAEAIDWPASLPLETSLARALLAHEIRGTEDASGGWEPALAAVQRDVASRDGGILSTWDHPPLLELAESARRSGDQEAACRLFRMRFLDSRRAMDETTRLLGVASIHDGLLLCGPNDDSRLRFLSLPRKQLLGLVAQARDELRGDGRLDACRTLGSLLFAFGGPGEEPLWIGSDGLLAEAPMLAVALSMERAGAVPPMRELVGLRRPPLKRGASTAIASFADALGDLPWAAREVARSEAALWLRGKEATRGRLCLHEPIGLLHLGLHARREQGAPQLLFADGPMGPMEIASNPLPGAPVVLLAGCATGVAQAAAGVERSLADAFLRAGASAVIATRWPVEDREIMPFVRAVIEAWPFQDIAVVVTSICSRLHRQGHPARCWAAPVVY